MKPSVFDTYNFKKYLFCIGGRSTVVMPQATEPYIRKGDVIGCALDLTVPVITFTFNGHLVSGSFRNFNLDGMFFPLISCSSKLRYSSWLWIGHIAVNNLCETFSVYAVVVTDCIVIFLDKVNALSIITLCIISLQVLFYCVPYKSDTFETFPQLLFSSVCYFFSWSLQKCWVIFKN